MNRRQYGFPVILSSFAGGAIASQERGHVVNPIQQIQKIIASEDFLLFDEASKVHGRWGVLENDRPGLLLKDFNDKVRAIPILSEAGSPSLAFIDATGKTRMRAFLSREGNPSLALMDKDRKVIWATPEIQR